MSSTPPNTLRRRQSGGTLEERDTTKGEHSACSDEVMTPDRVPRHARIASDAAQPNQHTTPSSQTAHPFPDIEETANQTQTHSHNTHTLNGHIQTTNRDGNKNNNTKGVQFIQQMSYISNLSQLTLKLTFREKYLSWRYLVGGLLHFVFYTAIFMRNCMPIALVCMTDPLPNDGASKLYDNGSSFGEDVSRNDSSKVYEFNWDRNTQSLILTGIQFSSCVGPLLCDMLRVRIGSKHTMTICTLVAALLTVLSPPAARISPWALFTIRVLLGIFLGANVSTTADLLSWWAPASEKQTLTSFVFAGVNIGGMIVSLAAGFLCSVPFDNGWPFIFYVFGFLAVVTIVAWHFLCANKPEDHRFISETECNFIMNYRTPVEAGPKGKPEKPPYKKIFTSKAVLSYLTSSCSQVWSSSLYFTVLPGFFVTVHKFTVEEAGIIMSMILLARFLGIPIWTMVINRLRMRNVSNTKTKKIVLSAGYGMCAATQVAVLFLDYQYRWVVVGLFLFLLGSQVSGMCVYTVLPMDMAPRYAGFLSGVFYSVGSLVGISAPLMVSALAPNSTREEWQNVWIITASVFVVSTTIFVTFGDATVQPWARVHRHSRPNIQSAFVSMGRRISAVDGGPIISSTPAVRGSRDFSFAMSPGSISMTPSGSGNSLANQETQSIFSTNVNSQAPPAQKHHYDSNGKHTPIISRLGVSNTGFEPDGGPETEMVDKVTTPTTVYPVTEMNRDSLDLEERYAREGLDYIDGPEDTDDSQGYITRL